MTDLGTYFYDWIATLDDLQQGENNKFLTAEDLIDLLALISIDAFLDVDTTTIPASEGDLLKKIGDVWQPSTIALNDCTDVETLPGALDGDALILELGSSTWINGKPRLEVFSLSLLPAASTRPNRLVFTIDASSATPYLAFSDGVDWLLMPFTADDGPSAPASGLDWKIITSASWSSWQTYLNQVIALNSNVSLTHCDQLYLTTMAGGTKWAGGVLAPNGKIYGVPYDSTSILKIDPDTETTSTFGSLSGGAKWVGGVLAPNERIYCIPFYSTSVLKINPYSDTATTFGTISGQGSAAFVAGGVLASNGKIYCAPHNGSSVIVIDTNTDTLSYITLPGSLSGTGRWFGAVLAPNGSVYCLPHRRSDVLKINPSTNILTTITTDATADFKWAGGVLAANGKIYAIPHNETRVLCIDPSNDTISYFGNFSGSYKWIGGFLAPNGKIYAYPYQKSTLVDTILEINPTNNTATTLVDRTNFTWNNFQYYGGVVAPNGTAFAIPHNNRNLLILKFNNNNLYDTPIYLSGWHNKL